ncbi:MAG: hypothetical protein ABIQ04_00145 [Candidatus Saccharimonadales bacterium]
MASRFWVGGVGSWTAIATANWSATSGGAAGASAPTTSDDAIFDTNSGIISGSIITINGGVCLSWQVAGPAVKYSVFSLGSNFSPIGSVILNGNSSLNRIQIVSNIPGTSRTITIGTLAAMSNIDFMDTIGAGAATPFTGTSIGDCQGNSGITFDVSKTLYWYGNAGVASDVTKWFLASGGAGGAGRIPLAQDDLIFDANSFSLASQTITFDMPAMGRSIDMSAVNKTVSWADTNAIGQSFYGSLFMPPTALSVLSGVSYIFGTVGLIARGRGSYTLGGVGGVHYGAGLIILAPGGTYTLSGNIGTGNANFSITAGTLDTSVNSYSIRCLGLVSSGALTRSVILNNSTVNVQGLTIFSLTAVSFTVTGLTVSAGNTTINLVDSQPASRSFVGAGQSFGTLNYTNAGSSGSLVVTGANTFTTINVGTGRTLTLPSSTITTVTNFNAAGTNNGYEYFPGATGSLVSTPSAIALQITGDIDLRCYMAADNYTNNPVVLIAKESDTAHRSYRFELNLQKLQLMLSADGIAQNLTTSSTNIPFAASAAGWVRATWVASTNIVQFFTSADPVFTAPSSVSWTQLGTNQTNAVASIFNSTSPVEIGTRDGGIISFFPGKMYRAQILSGVGGTVAFDANFTTKPFGANSFTESSVNAATVTITGAVAQAGDGRTAINASTSGTAATLSKASGVVSADYLTVQDSTANGGATFYAGSNSKNVSNNTGWIFTSQPATAIGATSLMMGVG